MTRHALCLASLLLLHGAANAAVTFQVHADTVNTPSPNSQNVPPSSSSDMQVVLGDSYLSVQTAQQIQIYDFAKRRRIEIDRAAKTYTDYSLYDTVGFREMELRNRAFIAKALASVKQDMPQVTPVDEQHVLSIMPAPAAPAAAATAAPAEAEAPPALERTQADGAARYGIAGTELLRASLQGTSIGAADATRFAQFLRYHFGGHPLVLRELEQRASIPATLDFHQRSFTGVSERKLSISAVAPAPALAAGYDLSAYSKRAAVQPALDQLLDQAAAGGAFGMQARLNKLASERQQAFTDKRGVEAMLITSEQTFVSGKYPGPATPEQIAVIRNDPDQARLAAAIQARNKADLPAAIATLRELRAKTSRPYLLKVFEANHHVALGDTKTATALFIEALQANPYMASVYKDLGDTLLRSFDAAHGWRCWDIGRQLAPGFQNFRAVDQYEATLAKNHPEYF